MLSEELERLKDEADAHHIFMAARIKARCALADALVNNLPTIIAALKAKEQSNG